MQNLLENACCFTGHRPDKLPSPISEGTRYAALLERIDRALLRKIQAGCQTFYCGMARGSDLLLAERLLSLKARAYPHLVLAAVPPYVGHAQRWNSAEQARHDAVMRAAQLIFHPSYQYSRFCFHVRNRFMVNRSRHMIAIYDGTPGGTRYTFEYAAKQKLCIERINPQLL